jgi:hypothetical protein
MKSTAKGYRKIIAMIGIALLTAGVTATTRADHFTTIDVPAAFGSGTQPFGINQQDDIVGFYNDSGGNYHGFLLSRGKFTTVDVPGADGTLAFGINTQGEIVGYYFDSTGNHGFVLNKGQFTTFDVPGGEGETFPQGINLEGDIVGYYSPPSGGYQFGFLLKGGQFTIIVPPLEGMIRTCLGSTPKATLSAPTMTAAA